MPTTNDVMRIDNKVHRARARALALACALFTWPQIALSAACCGGGFTLPSLLTGDDRAQLTTSLVTSNTAIDVQPSGKWLTRDKPERSETLRLEGAKLVSDLWQLGASLPVTRRSRMGPDGEGASGGLGDFALTAGYEALPEWDYNSWRPKGIAYLQLVLPTGRSRLESANELNLDITGRGFYTLGPGIVLLKVRPPFDAQLMLEVHRSLSREIESPQAGGRVHLDPKNGATASLAGGWSQGDWRFGIGALFSYEDAIGVSESNGSGSTAAGTSDIALERFGTVTASLAYMIATDWAASAAYSDQTLLGSPSNTTLSRTLLIALQRRWQR